MAFYFEIFPMVLYKDDVGKPTRLTDITKRYRFIDEVLNNKYILYSYDIKEGERPDIIAEKYYGDASEDYLVLLMNKLIDPFFQWPMDNNEFTAYLIKKYGTLSATSAIGKYYRIIQAKEVTYDGFSIPERTVEVDATEYAGIAAEDRRSVTIYEWEQQRNEDRRSIKLIDKSYMPQIRKELSKLYG